MRATALTFKPLLSRLPATTRKRVAGASRPCICGCSPIMSARDCRIGSRKRARGWRCVVPAGISPVSRLKRPDHGRRHRSPRCRNSGTADRERGFLPAAPMGTVAQMSLPRRGRMFRRGPTARAGGQGHALHARNHRLRIAHDRHRGNRYPPSVGPDPAAYTENRHALTVRQFTAVKRAETRRDLWRRTLAARRCQVRCGRHFVAAGSLRSSG